MTEINYKFETPELFDGLAKRIGRLIIECEGRDHVIKEQTKRLEEQAKKIEEQAKKIEELQLGLSKIAESLTHDES